ncbi:MAG: hypothetical protein JSS53_02435 [Proteobacteria bacterium]|nr:hypothetical protein [Pseudomonadota bacterium]
MSLQLGFFPKDRITEERLESTIETVGVSKSNIISSKKERDRELEELLTLFCEPSSEKLPGS